MNHDVTDASDFSKTSLPQLSQLDTLLRCHVCKDFLKTPVLTPCSHTFCSLCIREYLKKEPKCPLCLSELRESSLRGEFLVNEIIESYKASRKQLLILLEKKRSRDATPMIDIDSDSDDDDAIQIVTATEKQVPKGPSADVGRVSKQAVKKAELVPFRSKGVKPRDNMAQCPICEDFFPIKILERTHLDDCLTLKSLGTHPARKKTRTIKNSSSSRNSERYEASVRLATTSSPPSHVEKYLTSTNSGDRQRLPKTNFTAMSVTQIKQKLASLGLATTGSRQNMVARYNHYEILWNSNFCDALVPVSETELKRQLVSWEATHNTLNSMPSSGNTISSLMKRSNHSQSYQKLLADFKNDRFNKKSWIKMFDKEFKSLIEEAKRDAPINSSPTETTRQDVPQS